MHGFTQAGVTVTSFDATNAITGGATYGSSTNEGGTTVGYYFDNGLAKHGFSATGGTYTPLDVTGLGSVVSTQALGINGSGTIVGSYRDGTQNHGFVDIGGVYTAVNDPLGAKGTVVTSVNSVGDLGGYYIDGGGTTHGFVDVDGAFYTVDDPNAGTVTEILGFNNVGQVVGYYVDNSGGVFGFTADVPEPGMLALLGWPRSVWWPCAAVIRSGSDTPGFVRRATAYFGLTATPLPGVPGGAIVIPGSTLGGLTVVSCVAFGAGRTTPTTAAPIPPEPRSGRHLISLGPWRRRFRRCLAGQRQWRLLPIRRRRPDRSKHHKQAAPINAWRIEISFFTNNLSSRIGNSRTRTPVACHTALAIAAATPTVGNSPIPFRPSGVLIVSDLQRQSSGCPAHRRSPARDTRRYWR